MSASGTLNLANYTTVWDDNFASNPTVNNNIFQVQWGNGDEFAASHGGLTMTDDGTAAGFLTSDFGASSGNGYGLYSVTFSEDSPATGAYICLWPGTNVWPGPEIDFYELQNGQAYWTVHWEGSGDSNAYNSYFLPSSVDFTKPTTIAVDWEKGSLTLYVNGQEVNQYTSGGSVPIPADYADGGQNEAFGVGLAGGDSGASLTVDNMSYSSSNGGSGSSSSGSSSSGSSSSGGGSGGTTSGSGTGTGSSSGGSTGTTTPNTWITVSNPGTVQEASKGAGVTVTETISDPGLTTAYVMVMNSANQGEANWQAVNLNSAGVGTVSAHFENSGDYLVAVNNPNAVVDKGWSNPVTITDAAAVVTPNTWITVSNPGTVQEASKGAGVTVTETLSDPGLTTAYVMVMNSANQGEANWQAVTLNSAGVGTVSAHFENSGDYLVAVNNPNAVADKGWSNPVTITDPAVVVTPNTWITVSNPGTVQEASKGAGVTVTETLSDPGLTTAYVMVMNSANQGEANWQAVTLNSAGVGTVSAHFENSGDYLVAVNNPNAVVDKGWSNPVTITDAAAITGSSSSSGSGSSSGGGSSSGSGSTASGGAAATVVTATDSRGKSATLPLGQATQTLSASATGLKGAITETTVNGATRFATAAGSGVTGLAIQDSAGGSWQTNGFADVAANLSGASSGRLTISGVQDAAVTLGSGNYAVRVSSSVGSATASIAAGSGTDRMTFVGPGHASFTAGAGSDTIVGGAGGNTVTFGTGTAKAWGGAGADIYVFHAGDGLQTIENFSAATGDVLDIDSALKASLRETTSGGSTKLSFGSASHGILLQGVSSFDTAQIHWT